VTVFNGCVYYVDEQNVYHRGPLFWLQLAVCGGYFVASFLYVFKTFICVKEKNVKRSLERLLRFYLLPFIGVVVSNMFEGMPGIWPMAAVSLSMVYMMEMYEEVQIDGLTGVQNRKVLEQLFPSYVSGISEGNRLYVFILDLDRFKSINDSFGHSVGDEALIGCGQIIRKLTHNKNMLTVRYGGDEFLIIGYMENDVEAEEYKKEIKKEFELWNTENIKPYVLETSVGYAEYVPGKTLEEWVSMADKELYREKKRKTRA
ncbi:MAG: GGDEF domain-containing protein, partial [Lachnospiraceae bacterium]|nr:GGDEF domain-containing protein [Lachnospiraceae bacterium]